MLLLCTQWCVPKIQLRLAMPKQEKNLVKCAITHTVHCTIFVLWRNLGWLLGHEISRHIILLLFSWNWHANPKYTIGWFLCILSRQSNNTIIKAYTDGNVRRKYNFRLIKENRLRSFYFVFIQTFNCSNHVPHADYYREFITNYQNRIFILYAVLSLFLWRSKKNFNL